MTTTSLPTFTPRLTDAERNAFAKAIRLNLAARVRRIQPGRYLVPSTTTSDVYAVWQDDAGVLHCPCIAGSHGRPCLHRAAVLLRKTQETALAQVHRLAQAPAVTAPAVRHPYPSRRQVALT